VFLFSELSEQAQSKAIDKNRDINVYDDWYQFVYDDAIEVASLFGLEIDKIYFSGFWSQGDGASFTGKYRYAKDSLKKVKEYVPNDTELHSIVESLQKEQKKHFYKFRSKITQRGNYYHSNTMYFDNWHDDLDYNYSFGNSEDQFESLLKSFAEWIYSSLYKEHEHLTSDELVKEQLFDDYYFDTEGNICHAN